MVSGFPFLRLSLYLEVPRIIHDDLSHTFLFLSFLSALFRAVAMRIGSGVACCCYTVMLTLSWGWRRPFEKTIRGADQELGTLFILLFSLSDLSLLLFFLFLFTLSAWMACHPGSMLQSLLAADSSHALGSSRGRGMK
ncbi:hypothetical protein GGI35DRAFT_92101 [Trichoderma velutinum]